MIRRAKKKSIEAEKGDSHLHVRQNVKQKTKRDSTLFPVLQCLLAFVVFGTVSKMMFNSDFFLSNVRKECPIGSPVAFSRCQLAPGTDCPFDCSNMPIYDENGQCTGEVECRAKRRCTCEPTRGGEWFCSGSGVAIDNSCKQKNPETYESCVCPRSLIIEAPPRRKVD